MGRSWRDRPLLVAAALALFTVALYARVAACDFIAIDDPGYVGNRWVRAGLTWNGVVWAFTRGYSANWHPLTWLSHMLDVELFGTSPIGPHVENALLHGVNAALLFVFLRASTVRAAPSALVALLFAVHPQRVESVAWVAERKDVLSALFFLLALLAYVRHAQRPSAGRIALVALAAALGLMAKPMVITLPCVLLLVDLWPLGRWKGGKPGTPGLGRLVAEKIPLFLLSTGSAVATLLAQSRTVQDLERLPLAVRVANALESWGSYVLKTVWPSKLAIFYPHPALSGGDAFHAWRAATLVAAAFFVAAGAWSWRARRSRPWLTTGWWWYVGMLVPVIGLVQVGSQSMADRYAYLPQIGLLLLAVFGLDAAVRDAGARRALALTALAAASAFAAVTWRQIGVWKDSETLLVHALAVTERNAMAHSNLGLWYLEQNDAPRAIEQFEARLALDRRAGTLVNLGVARSHNGQPDEAIRCFEEALELDPRYDFALANLAALLLERGDAAGAVRRYEQALRERPNSAELRAGLERARARLAAGK